MGASECAVAILYQAIDSNAGTASIMSAGRSSSAAGPPQTPGCGSSLTTSAGSSSSYAPMAPAALSPAQMLGVGLAWKVAPAERRRPWEVPLKGCSPSKTEKILTLAMDKLVVDAKKADTQPRLMKSDGKS